MHRGKFGVALLRAPQAPIDASAFEDFARGIVAALRRLGRWARDGRPIFLGGAGVILDRSQVPDDAIFFNAEQFTARDAAFVARNLACHRGRILWEYAEVNLPILRAQGVRPVLCPVGYVPEMERITPCAEEDIDVLHYGALNPRRLEVLRAVEAAGLRTVILSGIYGKVRDAHVARAKVVLNIHYYERPIFEIFRVSHLLANGRCVVSEDGGQDPALEDFAARATRLVPRDRIVEACRELVASASSRRDLAERGREEIRRVDLVESVRRAIEETEALDRDGATLVESLPGASHVDG